MQGIQWRVDLQSYESDVCGSIIKQQLLRNPAKSCVVQAFQIQGVEQERCWTSSFKGKRSRYENIERQISNIQGILFPPAPLLQTVSATMLAILVSVDYMT